MEARFTGCRDAGLSNLVSERKVAGRVFEARWIGVGFGPKGFEG